VDSGLQSVLGFFTLLLLPFLGIMGLLRKRAVPWLAAFAVLWTCGGFLALQSLERASPDRAPLERAWRVGTFLALAFLGTAWLVRRRSVARWLKFAFATAAVVGFLRALYLYVNAYA
jgi:hypothetical protein